MEQKKTADFGLRAGYTVEAALLMGVILPLYVGIIYMGFYLHDRAFLQGAAHEAAACASLHLQDQDADMESAAAGLVSGRLLGTSGVSTGFSAGEKEAQAVYQGSFSIPGIASRFFESGNVFVKASVTLSTERPSKKIQKIRGAAKIFSAIRRTRE